MSCASCERRKLACDLTRPRCAACRRSHLKCEFKAGDSIQFQDETENVKARSHNAKRRKKSNDQARAEGGDASPAGSVDHQNNSVQTWETTRQDMPSTNNVGFMPWVDDVFEGYLPDASGTTQFWNDLANSAMFADLLLDEPASLTVSQPIPISDPVGLVQAPAELHFNSLKLSQTSTENSTEPLEEIPDHFLAQHYTRTLTSRYSSKDQGWNYYAHFYHRFTNSHSFVLAALYAWTSAHLFFAGTLKSLDNAFNHYGRCLQQILITHNINVTNLSAEGSPGALQMNQLSILSDDDIDAIGVSLYFLASTDLLASRRIQLRGLVQAMTALHLTGLPKMRHNGLFLTVSSWFCFLDARVCAFGLGKCSLINAMGDEEGMVAATQSTSDFLRQEYKILYPAEEVKRDEAHLPLLDMIVRLVANFGTISRLLHDGWDQVTSHSIRTSLDSIREALKSIDEAQASQTRVLSTLFTTTALYHATEIYYSRASTPEAALYSANPDAIAIILTTEKLYRVLKYPKTEPPPTKMWPIPLLMAAIEAKDPIYRDWALRKMADYSSSGEHFRKSLDLVERIWEFETNQGRRANLANVVNAMEDNFVV